jgi:hypothetical protein
MNERQPCATEAEPAGRGLRARPAIFRALGRGEPPPTIEAGGAQFDLVEVFKHDSWAATALYGNGDAKIVVKFNRRQPLLFVPMGWLGRWLARREARAMRLLRGVACFPEDAGGVRVSGRRVASAAAHVFAEGHPLHIDERPGDDFFPRLDAAVRALHRLGMAYVDLNKRENIIVTEAGAPLLVDFQIHFRAPRWLAWLPPVRWLLRELQAGDFYHLQKHIRWHRPDLVPPDAPPLEELRPAGARLWRGLYTPLLAARRKLFVWLRIRGSGGLAVDELEPEKAARITRERAASNPPSRTPGKL